eukprot:4772621-Amphidinium_carterae.1
MAKPTQASSGGVGLAVGSHTTDAVPLIQVQPFAPLPGHRHVECHARCQPNRHHMGECGPRDGREVEANN